MASEPRGWIKLSHFAGVTGFLLGLANLAINYWMYERTRESTEIARKAEKHEQQIFVAENQARSAEDELASVIDDASIASVESPFVGSKEVEVTIQNASKNNHLTLVSVEAHLLDVRREGGDVPESNGMGVRSIAFPRFLLAAGQSHKVKFMLQAWKDPSKYAKVFVNVNDHVRVAVGFEMDQQTKEYRKAKGLLFW